MDDLGDHRPGMKAAAEHGVRAPLIEAELWKAEIRDLSKELGLPTWDKPAFACLSSRFQYGDQITAEKLRQVDEAEAFVRSLGFRQFRVRHHDRVARLEIPLEGHAAPLAGRTPPGDRHAPARAGLRVRDGRSRRLPVRQRQPVAEAKVGLMDREALDRLLDDVRAGRVTVDAARARLVALPFEDLGFAKIDVHRALRAGGPEAVFCPARPRSRWWPSSAAGRAPRQRARHALRRATAAAVAGRRRACVYHALRACWSFARSGSRAWA
jgi:hypothetical protein